MKTSASTSIEPPEPAASTGTRPDRPFASAQSRPQAARPVVSEDENFLQRARRAKLDALVERGVQPFAYSFDRTHTADAAVRAYHPEHGEAGPSVRVAGRIIAWRGHGKTAFAHVADE